MRLYLDANSIIYCVEGASAFRSAVLARITPVEQEPAGLLMTSRLSRLECRVKPMRDANVPLLQTYDSFFSKKGLLVAEVGPQVIEIATELRAKYGFRTPDALHLATAIVEGADGMLTGDRSLARCTEVHVEVL